jgi:micrococcal nuclease
MHTYKCTILRVVDGDTVDVDIDLGFGVWMRKERIRVLGIDTPESRTRDKVEKTYGIMAKEFVKSYLPVGSVQTLQTEKDGTGKFGRILGKFLVHDIKEDRQMHLGDIMIREHLAVAYHGQSKEDIAEQHIKNRELCCLPEIKD